MTRTEVNILAWTCLGFGWAFGIFNAPYFSLGFFTASGGLCIFNLLRGFFNNDDGPPGPLRLA